MSVHSPAVEAFLRKIIETESATLEITPPTTPDKHYVIARCQESVRFARHLLSPEFEKYIDGANDEQ